MAITFASKLHTQTVLGVCSVTVGCNRPFFTVCQLEVVAVTKFTNLSLQIPHGRCYKQVPNLLISLQITPYREDFKTSYKLNSCICKREFSAYLFIEQV